MDTTSLKFKAACVAGLVALAVVMGVAWPAFLSNAARGGASHGAQMQAAMEQVAARLDAAIAGRQRALAQAAARISREGLSVFPAVLFDDDGLAAMFDEAWIVAPDGKLLSDASGSALSIDRSFLQRALSNRKPLISTPFLDRQHETTIAMSAPVLDEERRVLAILVARLNLAHQHMFAVANDIDIPATGRIDLVARDGSMLASFPAGKPSVSSVSAHSQREWRISMRLPDADWSLTAISPLSAPLRFADVRWQVAAYAIAGVLALMALAWLAVGRWLAPLQRLRIGMEAMQADPHAHVAVEVAGHDEIGRLADAFNKLMHSRRHAVQGLIAEKEWVAVTLNSIADAVVTTDDLGIVEYLNRTAESLTGWSIAEARGKPLTSVLHIEDEYTKEAVTCLLEQALTETRRGGVVRQYILQRRDGRMVPIDESAAPIRDETGQLRGLVFVFRDVTQQRKITNRARWYAEHDALTGLANRRAFEDALASTIRNAGKRRLQSFLMLLDLDHFKRVNDTGGHAAGDALLKQIAKLMQSKVRSVDLCARLGGDEFAILLHNCPQHEALHIAHKIRKAIHELQFVWHEEVFKVGVSIGATPINHQTLTMGQAMQQADNACYRSKAAGRNQVALHDSGIVAAEEAMA